MSKRGLHLRLVASGLAEMDQPETRYCPDEMELTGFIERTLDERGHERVRLHVRTCSHCRELLDEVAITMAADPQKEVRRIQRRKRLHELVDVARKCFGGIRELAAELGCDPSHVYPDDGDPGLVYECVLAKALGWTHDALAEFADEPLPETSPRDGHSTFDELDSAFKLHFLNGRNEQALELARRASAHATTAEQRTLSCQREAAAYNELGHPSRAFAAYRCGLREAGIPDGLRMLLMVNLANTLCAIGELCEARAVADAVIRWFKEHPPKKGDRRDEGSEGFAFYVRGNVFLRHMEADPENAEGFAEPAKRDLKIARARFKELYARCQDPQTRGFAETSRAGMMVAEAALDERDPRETVDEVLRTVATVTDPASWPRGVALEDFGWWCVRGARIALCYLSDSERDRDLKMLLDRGLGIADRLDNWLLRERLFSIWQAYCESRRRSDGGVELEFDRRQLRLITGTIARFPAFRQVGLKMLRDAKLLGTRREGD